MYLSVEQFLLLVPLAGPEGDRGHVRLRYEVGALLPAQGLEVRGVQEVDGRLVEDHPPLGGAAGSQAVDDAVQPAGVACSVGALI